MNIEHMKPLIHGHQLRGQSGQLFLVISLSGPSAYYFTNETMFSDRAIVFYKHKAGCFVPVFHTYSGSFKGPALKCQQATQHIRGLICIQSVFMYLFLALLYVIFASYLQSKSQTSDLICICLQAKLSRNCVQQPVWLVTAYIEAQIRFNLTPIG